MKLQKFREEFTFINITQEIKSDCNTINIINTGTSTAIINGVSLLPGDQYYVQGNEGELNETRYIISFTGAGTEEVKVIRKIYN
jgi:hypothetical protein